MASADSSKLASAALRGLKSIWRYLRYKKAGVILLELAPAACMQGDLWETPDTARRKGLKRTLDRLNAKIRTRHRNARRQGWGMRAERRSPRYTTDWDGCCV